ncbi:NAD-dependent epimerase/dehydratase family protein [Cellulosimicrobium marinum]|uniref:NAD-dependent epimerase/dehydratase family protein n=1 Tax=Cellulosimicrobium marinum TaxID=1638992 RepID=UPI001E5C5208|nr:NAD-dependent epimerase/dehydratase family protein [Cellulosimicrobium marinum]MCB7135896.1 NAD-dependent epimerase/dehydratase family protein [Cellulosimicrobium marinum]
MRILVTGGAGFIGSATVRSLVSAGNDVVVLDSLRPDVHGRPDTGARAATPPDGVRLLHADVRDGDAVAGALDGCEAVVHLAAKVGLGVGIDDVEDYVSSNDLGTAVLLRAAATARPPHVVYASSMVVYGEGAYSCPEHGPRAAPPRDPADLDAGVFDPRCPACSRVLVPGLVTEDAPFDPRNVYAATKTHGEHLLAAWARATGATATALRFHNVYGPGMPRDTPYAGVVSIFRSEAEHGRAPRVFEDGGQRRDLVHVDDVAAAVRAAVEQPQAPGQVEAFNVGSGVVTTVGEVARRVAALLGAPDPVVTGAWRAGDVRHVTASSAKAARVLGWQARVTVDDGLAQVVADRPPPT